MKSLFSILFLISFSHTALACTDFSGNYQSSNSGKNLLITQKGCEEMTWDYGNRVEVLILDNQKREMYNDEYVTLWGKAIFDQYAIDVIYETELLFKSDNHMQFSTYVIKKDYQFKQVSRGSGKFRSDGLWIWNNDVIHYKEI